MSGAVAVQFWPAAPARLYALLDAAADPSIHPTLRALSSASDIVSLYEGKAARDLAAVAPYLLDADEDGAAFAWLDGVPSVRRSAVFLAAEADIGTLRAHWRRLSRVRMESGATMLFRFYDPFVLRTFLPTCDSEQLKTFFGPVSRIILADRDRWSGFWLLDGVLQSGPVANA